MAQVVPYNSESDKILHNLTGDTETTQRCGDVKNRASKKVKKQKKRRKREEKRNFFD